MKINCFDKQVGQFLSEAYYKIPRFQRAYSWDHVNVEEFWNDTVVESETDYFIGSFVVGMFIRHRQTCSGFRMLPAVAGGAPTPQVYVPGDSDQVSLPTPIAALAESGRRLLHYVSHSSGRVASGGTRLGSGTLCAGGRSRRACVRGRGRPRHIIHVGHIRTTDSAVCRRDHARSRSLTTFA